VTEIQLVKFRTVLEAKEYEVEQMLTNRAEITIEKTADAIDEVQNASERDLAIRNLDRESKLLFDVRSALRRTKEGTFGICLNCEEEISAKRLAAVPWAPYCIACQEQADQNRAPGDGGMSDDRFESAAYFSDRPAPASDEAASRRFGPGAATLRRAS
jgi:DnaK suppressor protein